MSQRTQKIISLAKAKAFEGTSQKYDSDIIHAVENDSLDLKDFDPISNWVIEVDAEILKNEDYHNKEQLLDDVHSYGSIASSVRETENSVKSEKRFFEKPNENRNLHVESDLEINPSSDVRNRVEFTQMKITEDHAKTNSSPEKIKIISHWILNESGYKSVNPSYISDKNKNQDMCDKEERSVNIPETETPKFDMSLSQVASSDEIHYSHIKDDSLLRTVEYSGESDNFELQTIHNNFRNSGNEVILIEVPPKKTVENFPLEDDFSIIIEEIPFVTENTEKDNALLCDNVSRIYSVSNHNDSGNSSQGSTITSAKTIGTGNQSQLTQIEESVEETKIKHYKDKHTFCFYCEKDVNHFPRHLFTWHMNEIEVQHILSYKSKSKERRCALGALGKRGNFLKNRTSTQLRPVKRVSGIPASTEDFLPCPHCLGFYKKKSLYRHTKQCNSASSVVNAKRQSSQSDGQTALLMGIYFQHDELLKKELFPRMRADGVTLTAKKDILICNYAYSYMKGRRSKGNLDLVRQNMRRLAKLLQYAKETNNEINELIDLLRPTLFQVIVNGVNRIGVYNKETDSYESPTVAMNFGTLIKKCCDLAYILLLQKPNTENRREELKVLKTLVESQWANEVSAQAGANLNSNKWNKEELLPLTTDLRKLKDYLEANAQKSFEELSRDENNQYAYKSLKEILYTQIILMNRRRPAEVSQIKVHTYKSVNLDLQEKENEFENILTETEKILVSSCSRIVIRGKRGRGVPIILSQKMREHFNFLLKMRDKFVKDNDYIFHTDGKSFFDGTKVVYKYAEKCGAENPKSISATKLRKHLATVTQLLQFSKSDLEQLSRFMGHTLKTHCDFYRLSDSTYQTAKISKLLLLATEGGLEKYKGLSLDEINIDLNPIVEECDFEEMTSSLVDEMPNNSTSPTEEKEFKPYDQQQSKKKCVHPKTSWSAQQKNIISKYFEKHIKSKRPPKEHEITVFKEEYPNMFDDRKWTSIKAVVYNIYTGKLRISD